MKRIYNNLFNLIVILSTLLEMYIDLLIIHFLNIYYIINQFFFAFRI